MWVSAPASARALFDQNHLTAKCAIPARLQSGQYIPDWGLVCSYSAKGDDRQKVESMNRLRSDPTNARFEDVFDVFCESTDYKNAYMPWDMLYDPFYGRTADEALVMSKTMTHEQLMAGADHYAVRASKTDGVFFLGQKPRKT